MISNSVNTDGKGRSRPLLALMGYVATGIDWSGRIIAVACVAVMFVLLFVNVVLRYTLSDGIPWAYEIHAVLLPWLVAGGVVAAAAQGRNICVSLLPNMLGTTARKWLSVAVHTMVAVICITVLWSSQPILKASQFQSLATLGMKQVWGYSSLIFAFGGMGLIALIETIRLLLGGDADAGSVEDSSLT